MRVVDDENGTWVFRDELDASGVCIARQQLQPNGWWSVAWTVEPEFWAGDPDEPTVPATYRRGATRTRSPIAAPGPVYSAPGPVYSGSTGMGTAPPGSIVTDGDGRVWTASGHGDWSTPGGPLGSIVSSSPPPAGGRAFTPDMMESITKAIAKGSSSSSPIVVSPAVKKMMDSYAMEAEKDFLFGPAHKRNKKKDSK